MIGCRRRSPLALAALLAAATAFAPAPAAAAVPQPEAVVWPRPPAAPRARRVASATSVRAARRPSFWRRAWGVVSGVAPAAAAPDALVRPFDVALRADGSFVVADPDRPGVVEYARDGAFVAELTCPGHPWGAPMSVALDDAGGVWIADASEAAAVRWSPGGCRVLRPAGLERPTGIAVARGRVALADPPAHRVLVVSADDGAVLARVGERGDGERGFNFPTDVAAGGDGTLWVVDALHFRVVRISADGLWLGALGDRGAAGAGLARPKGVHVDAAGRVYVTDAQRDVALVFGPDGALEYLLGEPGGGPGQLAHPAGISTAGDRLVVADSMNRRAEIFELVGGVR